MTFYQSADASPSWFLPPQVSKETHRREESDSIWEAQCTLTLWLAQLVLIPFDLAVVDSSITQQSTRCSRCRVLCCQASCLCTPGMTTQHEMAWHALCDIAFPCWCGLHGIASASKACSTGGRQQISQESTENHTILKPTAVQRFWVC